MAKSRISISLHAPSFHNMFALTSHFVRRRSSGWSPPRVQCYCIAHALAHKTKREPSSWLAFCFVPPEGNRTSLASPLAPTNPSVRALRHGKTSVFPTPFPFESLAGQTEKVYVPPEGFEPPITGSKPVVISISLQGRISKVL